MAKKDQYFKDGRGKIFVKVQGYIAEAGKSVYIPFREWYDNSSTSPLLTIADSKMTQVDFYPLAWGSMTRRENDPILMAQLEARKELTALYDELPDHLKENALRVFQKIDELRDVIAKN